MGRRWATVFGAVLALVLTLVVPAPAHAAERSYLHVETGITADRTLVVHGALYTPASQPIANQQVTVGLSSGPSGSGTTGKDGWFMVQLRLTSGPEQVVTMSTRFAGTGEHEAVTQNQQLKLPADPSYRPSTSAANSSGASTLKLTASLQDPAPQPGDAISLTGQLTDASGRAIDQGQITAEVNGQPGRSTTTDASGKYTAQAQIPAGQAPGKVAVVVKFAGGGGLPPVQTQVEVTVARAESATPSTAAPTSSAPATPPPSDLQTTAPSSTPIPALPPPQVSERGLLGQWQVWAALAAIVAIAAAAIWFGVRQHRRRGARPFAADRGAAAETDAEVTDATGSWLLDPSASQASPAQASPETPPAEPATLVAGPETSAFARGQAQTEPQPDLADTAGPAPRHAQVDLFPPDIFSDQERESVGWANDANTRTATRMLPAQDHGTPAGDAPAEPASRPARGIPRASSEADEPGQGPRRARRGL